MLYEVIAFNDNHFFRGHSNSHWRLIPALFRGNPGSTDLAYRLDRTCGFLTGLGSLEDYRELADTDDREMFLGLVGVAQCCGFTTHLIEFTGDMRAAASFAANIGRAGDIGEIILMRRYQFDQYADVVDGPYGRMIHPEVTAKIRQSLNDISFDRTGGPFRSRGATVGTLS